MNCHMFLPSLSLFPYNRRLQIGTRLLLWILFQSKPNIRINSRQLHTKPWGIHCRCATLYSQKIYFWYHLTLWLTEPTSHFNILVWQYTCARWICTLLLTSNISATRHYISKIQTKSSASAYTHSPGFLTVDAALMFCVEVFLMLSTMGNLEPYSSCFGELATDLRRRGELWSSFHILRCLGKRWNFSSIFIVSIEGRGDLDVGFK